MALLEKGDKNQLDGTVAPGKKMNGVIGYEVPADWKELEKNLLLIFGLKRIFLLLQNIEVIYLDWMQIKNCH